MYYMLHVCMSHVCILYIINTEQHQHQLTTRTTTHMYMYICLCLCNIDGACINVGALRLWAAVRSGSDDDVCFLFVCWLLFACLLASCVLFVVVVIVVGVLCLVFLFTKQRATSDK